MVSCPWHGAAYHSVGLCRAYSGVGCSVPSAYMTGFPEKTSITGRRRLHKFISSFEAAMASPNLPPPFFHTEFYDLQKVIYISYEICLIMQHFQTNFQRVIGLGDVSEAVFRK